MDMTQFHSAIRLNIRNHYDSNFCVGRKWNFKNFYIIEIKIKFAFEWYAYHNYCCSRIRNIAKVVKIEHAQ